MKMFLCKLLMALAYTSNVITISFNARPYIPSTFKAPSNFGRTNFIVGFPNYQTANIQKHPVATRASSTLNEAYFSPDDNLQQKLIEHINTEKNSIRMAIFSFTDKKIAEALYDAHKRGVQIEIITDQSCHNDKFSKISYLKDAGIPIFIYDAKKSPHYNTILSNIMHNKFIIFDKNKNDNSLIWTGSFNLTRSADQSNQENVILTDASNIVKKFNDQFAILKKRSQQFAAEQKK